jgi:DNA-binding NarL/FixJ family response regulator
MSAKRSKPTPQEKAGRASAAKALKASAERRAMIARLRSEGWKMPAIAAEVGLTKQRVWAILKAEKANRSAAA